MSTVTRRAVIEADLVNFINTTGMTEVMFNNLVYIDEKSAVRGGRAVPGALAYSIAEGLLVQYYVGDDIFVSPRSDAHLDLVRRYGPSLRFLQA